MKKPIEHIDYTHEGVASRRTFLKLMAWVAAGAGSACDNKDIGSRDIAGDILENNITLIMGQLFSDKKYHTESIMFGDRWFYLIPMSKTPRTDPSFHVRISQSDPFQIYFEGRGTYKDINISYIAGEEIIQKGEHVRNFRILEALSHIQGCIENNPPPSR